MALEILKRILQVEHTCHFPNLNPISGFIPKILRFYVILAFIAGRQESGTFLNSNATTLHSPCSDPCLLTFLFFDSFLAKSIRPFPEKEKGSKMILQGAVGWFSKKYWSLSQFLTFLTEQKKVTRNEWVWCEKSVPLMVLHQNWKTKAFDLETKVWWKNAVFL